MRNRNSNHSICRNDSFLTIGKFDKMKMHKLGKIQITGERKVQMVELDIDVDEETKNIVCHAALREITSDGDALFNYGFNQALKRLIETEGKKCTKKSSSKKRSRR
jgi:hypothetical protein